MHIARLQEGTARKKDVFDTPDAGGALSGLFDEANGLERELFGDGRSEPFEKESKYYHRTDPQDRYGVNVSYHKPMLLYDQALIDTFHGASPSTCYMAFTFFWCA